MLLTVPGRRANPNPSIVVIGSANVDLITRVPRLPRGGETVLGGRFSRAMGGKGANTAVAAARAAAAPGSVALVAAVGDDAAGHDMLDGLRADGVDTTRVLRTGDHHTGTASILVDDAGENLIAVAPGANATLDPAAVDAAEPVIAAARLVMLQMEVPPRANRRAIELAARHGVDVLLNYAPARPRSIDVDARVAGLIVNRHEAAALAGEDDPADAAAALRTRGPRFVIVTLGADGALLADPAGTAAVPAFPADAVDTTAAGDTFCGALAAALAEGRGLRDAARFAAAAAALGVTRPGAQPSIPQRGEIESTASA